MPDVLVRVRDLKVYYPLFRGFVQRLLGGGARFVRAVDGISFEVQRGEVFGLVGESGCGKSTAGRSLMGLTPIEEGEIVLEFPSASAKPQFIRPRELKMACVAWWAVSAAYLATATYYGVSGSALFPFGLVATVPGPYVDALGIVGSVQVLLGIALWLLRPWSRRPARLVAGIGAAIAFASLPWGLLLFGVEVGILVYLGTPDPSGLVRRQGLLLPATKFTLTKDGILEGIPRAEQQTWFERWFIGPRTVRTAGFSWVLKQLRGKVQIVYQDPHAALNPALTVGELIRHALQAHAPIAPGGTRASSRLEEVNAKALKLLDDVGLRPPDQFFAKQSTDMSGGQKQRVVIARALAPKPLLLVADEPVAMLDMSIRAKVLELLLDLKEKYGLTYVFITHDLATAKLVCDRIAIMYLGRLVEAGEARRIYADPKHPYTRALLQAIPIPDPSRRTKKELPKGEVPDAVFPPAGCRFHPRCPVALPTCGWEGRDFLDYLEERWIDPSNSDEEAALGPIEDWKSEDLGASRSVRKGDPEVIVARVQAALKEAPKPLAEAVDRVALELDRVVVSFRPPARLEPKEVEGRIVECLLY